MKALAIAAVILLAIIAFFVADQSLKRDGERKAALNAEIAATEKNTAALKALQRELDEPKPASLWHPMDEAKKKGNP
jgi:type II secretory pathway component PulJ